MKGHTHDLKENNANGWITTHNRLRTCNRRRQPKKNASEQTSECLSKVSIYKFPASFAYGSIYDITFLVVQKRAMQSAECGAADCGRESTTEECKSTHK